MKRYWKPMLCLLIALVTLSSCAGNKEEPKVFAEVTQNLGPVQETQAPPPSQEDPEGVSVFARNPGDVNESIGEFSPEDALGEENYMDDSAFDPDAEADAYNAADAYATPYPFAGSTPIPLDPVDMPSPTPRTALVFAYAPYSLSSLGLNFEGPQGWIPDESGTEIFTLTEPESQLKDGQLGMIKIYASPVNSNYSENDLKAEITQRLKDIGATNFSEWSPSMTASRFLMGGKGIYANYSGTLANGVKVGGRIHSTCLDKVLYTIEIVYPQGYKEDYLNIFSKMRSTIKRQ